jgi:hypothetical protein
VERFIEKLLVRVQFDVKNDEIPVECAATMHFPGPGWLGENSWLIE